MRNKKSVAWAIGGKRQIHDSLSRCTAGNDMITDIPTWTTCHKDHKERKDRNGTSMVALMTDIAFATQQLKAVIHDRESFFLGAY